MMTTIRDVAALAGVSVATVSRALSGSDRVTASTREKVEAAAAQLKYRPNAVAAAMRTGRTGTVGLVIADITNPFMTRLAASVENVCRERGWVLAIGSGSEEPAEQERVTSMLMRQRIDGLLIVVAGDATVDLQRLVQSGTPVVALDRCSGLRPSATILNDPAPALQELARHLREQGYERPAVICGPENVSTGGARGEVARTALVEAGLAPDAVVVDAGPFTNAHGRAATARLLDSATPPDVFVALGNLMAQGALSELQARGLDIGPQVGLTAFDDEPWFALTSPPLSCITQPVEELARAGVETLARLLDGEPVEANPAPMTGSTFIARASTQRTRG